MSGESEKRKSKKKSKHRKDDYDDYVEEEVAKAMKQVMLPNRAFPASVTIGSRSSKVATKLFYWGQKICISLNCTSSL